MPLADALPPRLRPFFSGRWPALWLGIICGYFVLHDAAPDWLDARDTRESVEAQRGLVERQRALAVRRPVEAARRDAALAWWSAGKAQRVRAASLAQASAELSEVVRRLCTRPGVTVAKLEAAAPEPISDDPQAQIIRLTLRIAAERMQPLTETLLALESAAGEDGRPWLRVGNASASAALYRAPGVQVEMTLYACVEAGL